MLAVVKKKAEYGCVEVIDVEEPKITKSNQVLIRVNRAAICGSDIHAYLYPESYHFMKIPNVLGHEFCGHVIAIGDSVNQFSVGDRVIGESNKYCGVCKNCMEGKTNICHESKMTGLHIDGVMAEKIVIEEHLLHRVTDNISNAVAATAQAITISIHGIINKLTINPEDTIIIYGPGIVGQSAAQIVRAKGVKNIFIVGIKEDESLRLKIARELGFKTIILGEQTVEEVLKRERLNSKVDTIIECSGASGAFLDGLSIIKKGGQLLALGIYNKPFEVPVTNLIRNEIQLITSYTSNWIDYERAINYLSNGIINVESLIKEYPLKEAVLAFEDAINKKVVKPVIVFNTDYIEED